MTNQNGLPDPRSGPLSRVTGALYLLLLAELGFLVATLPTIVAFVLLARDASNLPLFALALLPVGPAFAATLFALRAARRADDLVVWPRFWRGWVSSLRDVLPLWALALVAATMLGYGIAFGPATGVPAFFVIASIVVLVALTLWAGDVVVIGALFAFRRRDIARLALYYLAARPLVTLGMLALAALAVALVYFTMDWALALAASLLAAGVLANHAPMIRDIEERFTAAGSAATG